MKPIPFFVKVRGLFASEKEQFWWHYFTNEELQLRKMDAWELAGVIEEARVHPGSERKGIVAEHMLNVRLAQIQAKASWGSGLMASLARS